MVEFTLNIEGEMKLGPLSDTIILRINSSRKY